jgi:hypothetical protein
MLGGELYNAEQKQIYQQEPQFFDAHELQPPPEPAELMVPASLPLLLKLQADISFSIALPPHWGQCSGSLDPNTSSSKLFLHPLQ